MKWARNLGVSQVYCMVLGPGYTFNWVACLLCSVAVRSCSCCMYSSLKRQGELLWAGLSSAKSGMCYNGSLGEQVVLSSRCCCAVPVLHSPVLIFLVSSEKSELQTDTNWLLYAFGACAPRHKYCQLASGHFFSVLREIWVTDRHKMITNPFGACAPSHKYCRLLAHVYLCVIVSAANGVFGIWEETL